MEKCENTFFHFDRNKETALAVVFLFTQGREQRSNAITLVFLTLKKNLEREFLQQDSHLQNKIWVGCCPVCKKNSSGYQQVQLFTRVFYLYP